jgi:phenylpropionate dioxygenase-like ring-hydroxylating dioxygenase large terminal subunit
MNVHVSRYVQPTRDAVADQGTDPIPAAPYYRPEYFDLEREAIFKRVWLNIGHVCELPEPGTFIVRPLEVAKASILITRAKDGTIRAFHNVCTHRGTLLTQEPCGKRSSFTCPYHGWTFNNDGELRSAPDFERFYVEGKKELALPPVSVDVCAGLIFINLDPHPKQSLREYLGPLADQLEERPVAKATTFYEYVYEIEGNWKVTYDNFQENYHLRFIHPRSGHGAAGPDNAFGYPERYGFHGLHRTQTIWNNPDPQPRPIQVLAFGAAMKSCAQKGFPPDPMNREYFGLFPNFFLLSNPTQHFSHTVYPISATRSRGVFRVYWIGEDETASERFGREYSAATARDVHCEDVSVIEAVQRGLCSGALEHMHYQVNEVLCRHLFNNVSRMVAAYKAEPAKGAKA